MCIYIIHMYTLLKYTKSYCLYNRKQKIFTGRDKLFLSLYCIRCTVSIIPRFSKRCYRTHAPHLLFSTFNFQLIYINKACLNTNFPVTSIRRSFLYIKFNYLLFSVISLWISQINALL